VLSSRQEAQAYLKRCIIDRGAKITPADGGFETKFNGRCVLWSSVGFDRLAEKLVNMNDKHRNELVRVALGPLFGEDGDGGSTKSLV